ncbi:spore coat protein U domain-containing protein [Bdellovibrio bacteriovorus]|uniref:spore coat protein U domain-containing protein n=1 Tax=Bdellovibrio bacteriovorus TaxID=959 RepID=UPI0035A64A70
MRTLFFLGLLLQGQAALACVAMQLQTSLAAVNFNNSTMAAPTFTVKANTQANGCNFFITFDYGNASSYSNRAMNQGSDKWPFQVSKDSAQQNILKHFPDVFSTNDVLTGTLPEGSNDRQANVTYYAKLDDSNPWLKFGNYTETLTARLYRGSPTVPGYTLMETRSIAFNYNAQKRADISITSPGGEFDIGDTTETMNFGNLSSGISRAASIILKYNAGYTLFASSQNNGRLKHASAAQFINYALTISGNTVNLTNTAASPTQVARVLGRSPASGTVLPVVATIGSVATNQQSGLYSDTITLTVQSAE